jgi:hypothetical protein
MLVVKNAKKTRLSSKRALEVLKFLVKKKFGVEDSEWNLCPFLFLEADGNDGFDCGNWRKVSVDITFKDGKGFTTSIHVAYRGYGRQLLEIRCGITSWATLLRKMEREANSSKKAAFFSLNGRNIFEPGDSIERLLVEMTLENGEA